MNAEKLWAEFCHAKNIDINTPYEAWAFCGGGPLGDELADLVIAGKKFGTASAYDEYILENALDEIPRIGDYSVILKDSGDAVCVIRNYEVYTRAFAEVSPFHAFSEGEGDCSLAYWRRVHTEFFEPDLNAGGLKLTDDSRIVCEKFYVEYIPGHPLPEEELFYVEPSGTYAEEIMAYRREMLEANSRFDGCYSLRRDETATDFIEHCRNWSNPKTPANRQGAKGNVILAIRKSDGKMVGCFQAHHILSERMAKYTGYAGYSVRPSERRKGYATQMLAKAKEFLASFGFKEIYVACLPENEGSRKTILANGGEYVKTVYLEEDEVELERYRIELS